LVEIITTPLVTGPIKRLAAKFKFTPKSFWRNDTAFSVIPRDALYPAPQKDPLARLALEIKEAMGS